MEDQRVAVVTGAARGIGLEIATVLDARGHAVVGVDLVDPTDPAPFAGFVVGDIRDRTVLERALVDEPPRHGRLDTLVNNAAVMPPVSPPVAFVDTPLDDLDAAYAVNVRAMFAASQLAARVLIDGGRGGSLVNLGSVHGERGTSGLSVYAATKGAIAAVTRCMAVELGPHGIRCNTVAPAPTATPALLATLSDDDLRARTARMPLGRLAGTVEVADVVAFLVSDQSTFVTGTVLPVDGGYLALGTS